MLEKFIALVAAWIISVISTMGYGGIVLLMAIESACIPLPSEIIMPFAGFLVSKGEMSLLGIALAGALGCVIGSIPAYYVGMFGGRPLAERYGKYLLISKRDLDWADNAFAKHGQLIIFLGRMLPGVRTFIAFPAGVARMNMSKFIIYTFIGSFIWCWLLGYAGMKTGEHWEDLKVYFHEFHYVIIGAGIIFLIWYVRRHFKQD
ncbi:DedA family protein [Methylotenera versatilis]|jgi:membrane protein DedA with SNARE-associated domain|uniref:SNARE associated Golgi protein-like protein n=1 Tax=Methylotenera versatilis (strain 301) TaxID=666681 RepID=D7DJ21_METV0|nr:DedA family protein [Methylotenera versatilis]ADI30056.1 SNARE associated Golgi protein-like protein [Methylotenera versatilis 301]